ncbi:PDGLE domain-containing protein [Nocardioides pacificus]
MSTQTNTPPTKRVSTRALWWTGLAVSLVIAAVLSFYASSNPDGLESVAEKTGFIEQAEDSATSDSPLSDYQTKGVEDERLSGAVAGIVGAAVVLVLTGGLAFALRRRSPDRDG